MIELLARYGGTHVSLDRRDIRMMPALSVDLRAVTSGRPYPDETAMMPPGTFALSVCGWEPDSGIDPIGEIRVIFHGREVRIVGALTGRPGVVEVTPDHIAACGGGEYHARMLEWLRAAA